ncbi:MAG: ABC transporter substrate-binding protein [Pseudomonadota bacterium]|nr:ABC transporter substrate-binding protein [Pseudomonadota bacterium]
MFFNKMLSGSGFLLGAAGALCFLAASLPSSDASAASAALQKVIDGAKKEGVLKLLWTEGHFGADVGINDMLSVMNKRYGTNIKLQFTQGRSFPANLGRLTQEFKAKQNSSTDVFLGGANHMVSGMKSGLLMKVDWEALVERPAPANPIINRVNPGGVGMAVVSRVVGIVYNTNLVKGADIPTSIYDVLKPKWKGQIAVTPYLTGFYQFAAPDMFGEKYMTDYVKRIKPQVGGFIGCNSLDKVASGQFAMLIFDCGRDATVRYQRRGAPMAHAVPKEIVRDNVIDLGVTVNADHPNVAKLFIVFQHTKIGQKLLWKHGAYDLEIYEGSKSKVLIDKFRGKYPKAKFLISTAQRAEQQEKDGINMRKFQKKFKKILRGRRRK